MEAAVTDQKVAARAALRGFVGPLRPYQVSGWAFKPSAADEHLWIEVLLDGLSIGRAEASVYYRHLEQAGIGEGDHGFVANVDRQLPLDAPDRVQVRATSADGATLSLPFGKPPPATAPSPPQKMPVKQAPGFRFPNSDPAQRPVFIFGAARSGTSAMAQALNGYTRYVGPNEGHLLDLLPLLLTTVDGHYERRKGEVLTPLTLIAQAPQSYMRDAVRHGFVELTRTLFPGGYWLDKTPRPEMTASAPDLLRVWPEARFIYMKRRAIENLDSRQRKFPAATFRQHCEDWVRNMTAWEAVRGDLAGCAVEIDQMTLAREPHVAIEALATLLTLNQKELHLLTQALTLDRPERTSERFGISMSLAQVQWDEAAREAFSAICQPTMQRFGYSEDAMYFLPGRETEALRYL
jgi:hypothetical protein